MVDRILFARIGYMTYYAGPQPGDNKPIGGGLYNKKKVGHEVRNFQTVDAMLYGYFQPYLKTKNGKYLSSSISLERIDPRCTEDTLENVLVIFFATRPKERGQVIIGWYNGATVSRKVIHSTGQVAKVRRGLNYYLTCPTNDAVLLPTWKRPILFNGQKKGKPGHANAFYLYSKGKRRNPASAGNKWIASAIKFVKDYSAENLLFDPMAETKPAIEDALEAALSGGTGQGFESSPYIRKAIEDRAMTVAENHFAKTYKVDASVHKSKPYDLLCMNKKTGKAQLYIEVKGTRTMGATVILTKNEVSSAKKHKTALFVLHSIKLSGKGKKVTASGGVPLIRNPWSILKKRLTPLSFSYHL